MGKLIINGVTKSYGAVNVLKDINLEIDDGEFLVLVGPSGCGKSTLLSIIAGLDRQTSGDIRIDDRSVSDLEPKERDIAMVFQSYALYPAMTVEKNIGFSLAMRGVPKAERRKRVQKVASLLQIEHLLSRRPANLSSGQRQRVAMGRALVREPSVFLFDEPLSNLDAKLRVEMRTEIKKLHRRLGTTIVYVTHDQIEAMTMATRIAVMKDGIIQQFGTPAEIYEHPVNTFVATFMGSPAMNLIPVTVRDKRIVTGEGTILDLPIDGLDHISLEQKLLLGVRPEWISVGKSGDSAQLSMKIEVVEPTGPDIYAALSLGEHEVVARLPATENLTPGTLALFALDRHKAVLFDAETGAAIAS